VADVFRAVQAAKKNAETRVSEAEYTLLMGRLSGRDFDLIQRAIDAALAEQHAQSEAVAWRDFPEQVPDPDTECLVEVAFNGGRYRAVDTWEMQSEAPLEWSSAAIQTGYDWSSHPGDVQRWIPISSITAPPATTSTVGAACVPDAVRVPEVGWTHSDRDRAYAQGWNACRAAMLASGGKASVPDGWKLVPAEPTDEMIYMMVRATRNYGERRDSYAAMLAATPEPPRCTP